MDLRQILEGVRAKTYSASGYSDVAAAHAQPAQAHIRSSIEELRKVVPPGYLVRASGSQTPFPLPGWPWFAILDPDVTSYATRGQYLVYLYSHDLATVYLSMNQGFTAHSEAARNAGGDRKAYETLEEEASAIRAAMDSNLLRGTLKEIDLGSTTPGGRAAPLPRGYQAGNVAALSYPTNNLPPNATLEADLMRFLGIYQAAVAAKRSLVTAHPQKYNTPATPDPDDKAAGWEFKPKDSGDYQASVQAHVQHKTRRHEAIVKEYGTYLIARGWTPATNCHPRDLVASKSGFPEVLGEVKTVKANAEFPVREAIGQLMTYRFFFYSGRPAPTMLAIFEGPIGDAFVELNDQLDILSVWREGADWVGCSRAVRMGLADR